MTQRFVCIHGHFYQPPRENAWLESIEIQDSAAPYHDWNQRIQEECYAPNGASRILDDEGRIRRIVNNYERISFNFGPTLLHWMEQQDPASHRRIAAAVESSRRRFAGHPSGLAQVYNHPILPLCNARDRRTQVRWGLRDFNQRFGDVEGMWLPETAVDTPSLEELAAQGLRFSILAPGQAKRWRKIGAKRWNEVETSPIDPRRPYRVQLPSGKTIALFFYDGDVSHQIAFAGLLGDGHGFAKRLLQRFDNRDEAQLIHVATDGESYGHHHPHGDMALAAALEQLDAHPDVELINYGAFLERFPPTHEVEIAEQTAWSCAHGLGRWHRDCGCSGGRPGWNQAWRAPLRQALDGLRDAIAPRFEQAAGAWLQDPWAARDAYDPRQMLDDAAVRQAFFDQHVLPHRREALDAASRTRLLQLFEMQRHAMLMYTSCAWFFDEISGIETVQVLQYAARAIQLARQALDQELEPAFLQRLEQAPSNVAEHPHGRDVYERKVRHQVVDLDRIAADELAGVLMPAATLDRPVHEVWSSGLRRHANGAAQWVGGRIQVRSKRVDRDEVFLGAFAHDGDHGWSGGVRRADDDEGDRRTLHALIDAFEAGDHPRWQALLGQHFPCGALGAGDLFRDRQRALLRGTLQIAEEQADRAHRAIYERYAGLLRELHGLDAPPPRGLQVAAERAIHHELLAALRAEPLEAAPVRRLLEAAEAVGTTLDGDRLGATAAGRLSEAARAWDEQPHRLDRLAALQTAAELANLLPFEVRRFDAENRVVAAVHRLKEGRIAPPHGAEAAPWMERFRQLAETLRIFIDAPRPAAGSPAG